MQSTTALLSTVPLVEAQQAKKVPTVGFLCPSSTLGPRLRALQQGLRELGYVEGKNIVIESRFAKQNLDRFPALAAELVRLKVDVIVPMGEVALHAARQVSKTIPIVMPGDGGDPVKSGYVASLARPGGNITGLTQMSPELNGKRLELLKEAFPKISRVGFLWNPTTTAGTLQWKETQIAAQALSVQLQSLELRSPKDLEGALTVAKKSPVEALIGLLTMHRTRIIGFAAENRLPLVSEFAFWADEGGLMSYGPDEDDMYRRAAYYVDKILKGAKPADLPVERPTKFKFVINLKTAKQTGLTIPPNVLARADRVIK